MARFIDGRVSSRIRSYPISLASVMTVSTSNLPACNPLNCGLTYRRFISHTPSLR